MICERFRICLSEQVSCPHASECVQSRGEKKIVSCSENGKTYRLLNDRMSTVTCIHTDNGFIFEPDKEKCDYVLHIEEPSTVLLIELKGKDIPHAVRQLSETYRSLGDCLRQATFHARIVAKSVPKASSAEVRAFRETIKKQQGTLMIKSNYMEETVSSVQTV